MLERHRRLPYDGTWHEADDASYLLVYLAGVLDTPRYRMVVHAVFHRPHIPVPLRYASNEQTNPAVLAVVTRHLPAVIRPDIERAGREYCTRLGEAVRYFCGDDHCVFGTPDRQLSALDPTWRTSTVLALADAIHETDGFDRMPILADALQDAGCDDEVVLGHCRRPEPHSPYCWVIRLITGKTQ